MYSSDGSISLAVWQHFPNHGLFQSPLLENSDKLNNRFDDLGLCFVAFSVLVCVGLGFLFGFFFAWVVIFLCHLDISLSLHMFLRNAAFG